MSYVVNDLECVSLKFPTGVLRFRESTDIQYYHGILAAIHIHIYVCCNIVTVVTVVERTTTCALRLAVTSCDHKNSSAFGNPQRQVKTLSHRLPPPNRRPADIGDLPRVGTP